MFNKNFLWLQCILIKKIIHSNNHYYQIIFILKNLAKSFMFNVKSSDISRNFDY